MNAVGLLEDGIKKNRLTFKVEYREGAKHVRGTILQEGRAASIRREIFAPGSVIWPASGINILSEHRGKSLGVSYPQRNTDGRITVDIPINSAVLETVRKRPYMSVEFVALDESRTKGGIREIRSAIVDAAAFVAEPEYEQATTEIRKRKRRWL